MLLCLVDAVWPDFISANVPVFFWTNNILKVNIKYKPVPYYLCLVNLVGLFCTMGDGGCCTMVAGYAEEFISHPGSVVQ